MSSPNGQRMPDKFASEWVSPTGTRFVEVDWEVFSSCERRHPKTGVVEKFDEQWQRDAVDNAKRREAAGYMAPVHIQHTPDDPKSPKPDPVLAGFFVPQSVETNSDGVPTTKAKVRLFPDVWDQVKGHRLPFRSVEIINPAAREISSLALLSSEVPFFKYAIPGMKFCEVAGRGAECAATSFYFAESVRRDAKGTDLWEHIIVQAMRFADDEEERDDKPARDDGDMMDADEDEGPAEDDFGSDAFPDDEEMPLDEGGEFDEMGDDPMAGGGLDPMDPMGDPMADTFGMGAGDPLMSADQQPVSRSEFTKAIQGISDQIAALGGTVAPAPAPPLAAGQRRAATVVPVNKVAMKFRQLAEVAAKENQALQAKITSLEAWKAEQEQKAAEAVKFAEQERTQQTQDEKLDVAIKSELKAMLAEGFTFTEDSARRAYKFAFNDAVLNCPDAAKIDDHVKAFFAEERKTMAPLGGDLASLRAGHAKAGGDIPAELAKFKDDPAGFKFAQRAYAVFQELRSSDDGAEFGASFDTFHGLAKKNPALLE